MIVYLCEKPSQARDVAAVLGAGQRREGYLTDGDQIQVTWVFGHLLDQFMPGDYHEEWRSWRLDALPMVPAAWQSRIKKSGAAQYRIVAGLLQKAQTVCIATDYDREGEAIARSIMERVGFAGTVKRVCLKGLDPVSVKTALANTTDGGDSLPMYHAALARQRADWIVGMNMSRLYTLLARQAGYGETLHIGRVITPTVALVCLKDREVEAFTPTPFWAAGGTVSVSSGQFYAHWESPADVSDPYGRCIDRERAELLCATVEGQAGVITAAGLRPGVQYPLLPFCLTSLQKYAGRRWGYTAKQVLDAAQSLYEKHKATTYPRTDSRYLPVAHRDHDVGPTLRALAESDPGFRHVIEAANPNCAGQVFNDDRIKAHHAIIPTQARVDVAALSEIELRLYDAIRRFYVAQFYPPLRFRQRTINVECEGHTFSASSRFPTDRGWTILFATPRETDPTDDDEDEDTRTFGDDKEELPDTAEGEIATLTGFRVRESETRPPHHYTDASLLAAMEHIGQFVEEPEYKKILRETSGLGTPATRAGIIQGAIQRGYLARKKRLLLATPKAHALVQALPKVLQSPGVTAAWEIQMERIATSGNSQEGRKAMDVFTEQIGAWIGTIVQQVRDASAAMTAQGGQIDRAFETLKTDGQADAPQSRR